MEKSTLACGVVTVGAVTACDPAAVVVGTDGMVTEPASLWDDAVDDRRCFRVSAAASLAS